MDGESGNLVSSTSDNDENKLYGYMNHNEHGM